MVRWYSIWDIKKSHEDLYLEGFSHCPITGKQESKVLLVYSLFLSNDENSVLNNWFFGIIFSQYAILGDLTKQ